MADFLIEPSLLQGSLSVPSSKSHTLRAILFAALSQGISKIEQFLSSPDTNAMIDAVRLLGAEVIVEPTILHIRGCGSKIQPPGDVIQCGNAGQVLRFVGALAGLLPHYTILTGDHSIRQNRPMQPLLNALQQLGAFAASSKADGFAPIVIKGPLTGTVATLDGQDSQLVSGLLIAGAFGPHPIEVHVNEPGEKPWIDLTLHWFKKLGIPYYARDYIYYRMQGGAHTRGFNYLVPGDFSTAAFPMAAALLTHSELVLHNIDLDDVQGDKAILTILEQMGAQFIRDKSNQRLFIKRGNPLKGIPIDVNAIIDALPILAVVGCFAQGRTEITNGAIARKKECDRISCMAGELRKMGARIEEKPDGLIIHTSQLHGAELNAHHDHRLALSLSVAALAATGPSIIHGVECAEKTYAHFYRDFHSIGAKIKK